MAGNTASPFGIGGHFPHATLTMQSLMAANPGRRNGRCNGGGRGSRCELGGSDGRRPSPILRSAISASPLNSLINQEASERLLRKGVLASDNWLRSTAWCEGPQAATPPPSVDIASEATSGSSNNGVSPAESNVSEHACVFESALPWSPPLPSE